MTTGNHQTRREILARLIKRIKHETRRPAFADFIFIDGKTGRPLRIRSVPFFIHDSPVGFFIYSWTGDGWVSKRRIEHEIASCIYTTERVLSRLEIAQLDLMGNMPLLCDAPKP